MNLRCVGQILVVLLLAHVVWATPQVTTYQARIIKPDGYPLEAASVNFKFTILSPAGNCILYSETYSVSMSGTGGLMSFPLGSGIRVYPASGTAFSDVFDNSVASLTCDNGGPADYQPDASDIRKIVMQFNDGNGWQTLPAMNINAVPYAIYANDAMKLGGVSAASYVQYTTLPTCAASESLSYNGTSFSCVVAGAAPTNVTSSTVIAALGYTPADGASVTTLSSEVSATVSTLQNAVAASFASLVSSPWLTSGTAIGYVSGSVGVGTVAPQGKFNVTGGDFYVGTGTPINGSTSEDLFTEGNLEVHGAQGLTIGSTAAGFLVTNTNSNRRSLALTGSGTASSESAGHLILGNNRATAMASDVLGVIEFGTLGNGGSSANRSGAKIETKLSGAGGANGFGAYTAFSTKPDNVAGVVEVMRITAEGNIGIGTMTPGSNTKLNVAGQIKAGSASITTGAVDWNVGNTVSTNFDCSANITFANLRDGGNYTLVVTSAGTTQCNFSATLTGDDAGTVSYRFKPANTVRDGSSHTIYSLVRIGNIVYVSWISGF